MSEPARWHVDPDARLIWRSWDGEYVVFHAPSGDTHVLNEFTAAVLRVLEEEPATLDELCSRLSNAAGVPSVAELRPAVLDLLERFSESGVVLRDHEGL